MTGYRHSWRRTRPLLPVILTLLLLSGCSTWDNLSAYFNTYYNASRLYEEAETEFWAVPELKSTGGDFLVPFTVPAGAKTKFTSVVEKCSKLLQYHPESGLVDDCLMMIGMSYYYQADFQRAQRKFLELLEAYPEGEFAMRARLMLARNAYKMNERQRAQELSSQLLTLAGEEGEDEVAAHAAGILGRLAYEEGQYEAARAHFETMAEGVDNRDLRAGAYLRVGTIDSLLGDYEAALEAYTRAQDVALSVAPEYRGAIGAVRMDSFLGEHGDALDRLEEMGSEVRFRESYGEIALELGHVLRRSGELHAAIDQYRFVDTAFVRTEASGSALYALGQIYEKDLHDFDSARVMYNKARGVLPPASILTPPVVRRADAMNKWAALRTEIARYDSTLSHMDSLAAEKESAPAANADTTAGVPDSLRKPAVAGPPDVPRDTVEARLASSMNELATLYFLTLEDLDAAAGWYRRVLDEYPDSRGAPRAMFALSELSARDSVSGAERADSLRSLLIERYPDSEFAAVARRILGLAPVESRSDTAGRLYAQAEAMYLAGRNEEAVEAFQEVVDRYPTSNDAARAQYAIGFIYENHLGLNDSAEVHYRSLAKTFPRTPYASTVQLKLSEVDQARREEEAARRRDSVEAARVRDSLVAAQAARTKDSIAALARTPADTLGAPAQAGAPADTSVPPPTGSPGDRPEGEPPGEEPSPSTPGDEPPPVPDGEPPPVPDGEPPPVPPEIRRPGYR